MNRPVSALGFIILIVTGILVAANVLSGTLMILLLIGGIIILAAGLMTGR